MFARFRDRTEAGRKLAEKLGNYRGRADVLVFGLPRGGVPVAFEVARALNAPLDVFIVRKVGVPWHQELAMGAIASGGVEFLNHELIEAYGISRQQVEQVLAREQQELARRERDFRGARPFPDVRGKTVILVDDGLATGSTMKAAVEALQQERAAQVVVAVPVSSRETCEQFEDIADEVVCAVTPELFHAVGLWYDDFSQTTDAEVHDLLKRARAA